MPSQSWQQTLITAQSDGTAVTGVAEGSLLPPQAKLTLPANWVDTIGKNLRVRAAGRISNIVTTPGTLTLRLKFGAIVVAATSAMQLNAVLKTNVTWVLDWSLDARVLGTSGNLMHTGVWISESTVASGTGAAGQTVPQGLMLIPASAPAVGANFDTTTSAVVDLAAIFSLTGNSIQLHQYVLDSTN